MLDDALGQTDSGDRVISDAGWGVYAFYDYEEEPIYVGQTNEQLRTRVRRHLTGQRTDAVGMRVLDPFEVAYLELWPLWELQNTPSKRKNAKVFEAARDRLNSLERSVYLRSIRRSRYGVILNEVIPPEAPIISESDLPASHRFRLISEAAWQERNHPDNRIARRAETLGRLADVVRERGEVSLGLRRVIVVQAIRIAWLSAQRLAFAEGREEPTLSASIDLSALIGFTLTDESETIFPYAEPFDAAAD